jgi:hypothetical protein
MSAIAERPEVGALLRGWRQRRRMSQLELSIEAFFPADDVTSEFVRSWAERR